MKYLLDTCLLSELVKPAPDADVLAWMAAQSPENLFVSAMTLAHGAKVGAFFEQRH